MPEFSYHCINCGTLLTPEDVVYDIAGIAFFGALAGDYSQFPIYATREEMETLFSWSEGKGTCGITLLDWIRMLYEQCGNHLDDGTREKDADTAYDTFNKALLKQQKAQEEYSFGTVPSAVIPGLPDNLSRILVGNCGSEEVCRCVIELDQKYGYSIVDYAGRENQNNFTDHRCCKKCRSTLLDYAFQCEQTLIGFIGFAQVGKTCLITALCEYLTNNVNGSQLLLRQCDERLFNRERKRYQNGFSLIKTATNGLLKVSPTIYMNDGEHPARMLTFVDIAGEAFNNDEGRFDPSLMENNFRAIADCSLYIFCTSLSAFETADSGSMQHSLENFVNHLSRNERKPKPGPIMVALMQMDESTKYKENKKDATFLDGYYYGREANQICNVCENEQLKAAYPSEDQRERIQKRLQSFLIGVGAMLYYTPITCSAYGRQPVKQENPKRDSKAFQKQVEDAIRKKHPVQIIIDEYAAEDGFFEKYRNEYESGSDYIEIIRQNAEENGEGGRNDSGGSTVKNGDQACEVSSLRFTPKPRNMDTIFNWIMRVIGEEEILSRNNVNQPLPPMECMHLNVNDCHTSAAELEAIARMFINPNRHDRELYALSQERNFWNDWKKRRYLAKISRERSAHAQSLQQI